MRQNTAERKRGTTGLTTIGEELAHQAMMNGDLEKTAGELKQVVVTTRNRRKCVAGSCIDPKDKKPGKGKCFTALEIAVHKVFQQLKDRELRNRIVSSYSDIVLLVILNWKEIAQKFLDDGLVDKHDFLGSFSKVKGKPRLTGPWVSLAIWKYYRQQFTTVFTKHSVKDPQQLSERAVRERTTARFLDVIWALDILGLTMSRKEQMGSKKTWAFFLKECVYNYSFEELYYLFSQGQKLLEKKKAGEFETEDQLGIISDEFDEEVGIRTITILPGKRTVQAQYVEVKDDEDGRVVIKIQYEMDGNT